MSAYPPNPGVYPPNPTTGYPGLPGEPPLHLPYYGCPPKSAVSRFFKKYATFSGRASRAEFWWVAAFQGVLAVVAVIIMVSATLAADPTITTTVDGNVTSVDLGGAAGLAGAGLAFIVVYGLWGLATLVPTLALGFRRCQDVNWPGAMSLIAIPVSIFAIVFGVMPPNRLGAQYDADGGAEAARLDGFAPPAQGGYGAPAQGGYAPPAQGGYQAPAQGGYGQPPAAQPYGQPDGSSQPPAADPYGQPPQGPPVL